MAIYDQRFQPVEPEVFDDSLTAAIQTYTGGYSTRKYSISPDSRGDRVTHASKEWQRCAWEMYDCVSEIAMASRLTANSASQAVLCPAKIDGCDVVRLNFTDEEVESGQRVCVRGEDGETEFEPIDPIDLQAADIGNQILNNVFGKSSQSYVLRMLVENLFVAGEGWLVQTEDPVTGELLNDQFDVMCSFRIAEDPTMSASGVRRLGYYDQDGSFRPFDENRTVVRFIYAHPKDPQSPTSSVKTVLEEAQTLVLLRYLLQATAKSGIHAGYFKVPNELAASQDKRDMLKAELHKSFTSTLADPAHPQSVAPLIAWGDAEFLASFEYDTIARPFDETLPVLMDRMERRLFRGLDLPVEIIAGIGESNHWSSWSITSTYVRNHIKPILDILLETLTRKIYHVALREAGIDPMRYCYDADTTAIAGEPNQARNANDAHDRGVLKHESYLEAMGFNPADDLADPIRQSVRGAPIGDGLGGTPSTDRANGTNPSRPDDNGDNQPIGGRRDTERREQPRSSGGDNA